MIKLREIIPEKIIKILDKDWHHSNPIDKILDFMTEEVHENNDYIFKRHQKFISYGELVLDNKTIDEAIEYLKKFKGDALIEAKPYEGYYAGAYEYETDEEYAERIYSLIRHFDLCLTQEIKDKKQLLEKKKELQNELKNINKILKNS